MNRMTITAAGEKRLRAELSRLKKKERPRIILAIAEARAHGDLSENAEYHAAKEEQGLVEARIGDLERALSGAQIIDPAKLNLERIVFGATVALYSHDGDEEVTYQIVGEIEADVSAGQVSVTSPLARALIGREQGEEIEVESPGGVRIFEVLSIRYC